MPNGHAPFAGQRPPPNAQRTTNDPYHQDSYFRAYHPETVFVANSSKETSINRLTIPIISAVAAALFLMSMTYTLTSQFESLKYAIDKLTDQVEQVRGDLAGRITSLERATKNGWTGADQEFWCARTEQLNSDIGWRCAERPGEPRRRKEAATAAPPSDMPDLMQAPPSVGGWSTK